MLLIILWCCSVRRGNVEVKVDPALSTAKAGRDDGKTTVVEGNGLREGMKVIIGSNQAAPAQSGQQSTSNPLGPQQQRRGPGGF